MAVGSGCSALYFVCWRIMGMSYTGDLFVENRSIKLLTSVKTRTNAISLLDVMWKV